MTHCSLALDVKVLLKKALLADLEARPITLTSKNGFVFSQHSCLSIGGHFKHPCVVISSLHGALLINGKPCTAASTHVFPMLSPAHSGKLDAHVSHWMQECKQDLDELAVPLHMLFDRMVASSQTGAEQTYELLDDYGMQVVQVFLQDFLATIQEDCRVQLPTLIEYAGHMFQDNLQHRFLQSLAGKNLTKVDRKNLQKDAQYRYEFFVDLLHGELEKMLQEFVVCLPHKILCQFLGEDLGHIEFDHMPCLGSFIVHQEKHALYIINSLDIDDYLLSVLRYEGSSSWSHEMNKVFAITCRTYLVYRMLQVQKTSKPYHIENGNNHQTYKGHFKSDPFKKAIDATKDLFVAYDGKPALTMYDACCGGVIPGLIDDLGYKKFPYLNRKTACTFCSGYKVFAWHRDISYEQLLERVQKEFAQVKKVVDMSVYKKDKAGIVKKVLINTGHRKIIISEKKFKTLFPEIKSYCFQISRKSGKNYHIEGKGFGHHRGLCQWGASSLIKNHHFDAVQVLQFYYPGTKLMRLTYQR